MTNEYFRKKIQKQFFKILQIRKKTQKMEKMKSTMNSP